MTDIASTDVTYAITQSTNASDMRTRRLVTLTFGNGSLTYPAGGILLLKAKLGLPNSVETFNIYDKGTSGYNFSFDKTNMKLVITQGTTSAHTHTVAAHTHDLYLKEGDAVDAAGTRVNAATDKFGANSGSSFTVAGQANGATAHGGIIGIVAGTSGSTTPTAAAGAEITGVAIAAQTLLVECVGW